MSNNPLSNMSYTNKDFNSIYRELLDLVKTLTYKWDPSISNESDPGNILLKLDAIIGDKNNYNIDKNILENFPETLTQDISARSLYKQLAYRMPWYQAATTNLTFKWIGKDANELTDTNSVSIDKFQLITDANNEFVYTTLRDLTFNKFNKTNTVEAMEGIITTLTLNGQPFIELNNLDSYNRVYFNETTVAENGIFIYNVGGSENEYWTMVDNLQVEPLGRKNFEFGIDARRNLCYVEFPIDINTLIGNGLVIKYIVTNGSQGNVISKSLDRFYEDVSVEVNGEEVVLDRSIIYITNDTAAIDGKDPEDLRTAYNNYRKTAGTFHTLVTLRDYINAVYNSGLVSNVKVCDRLNDVQSTYEIVPDDTYGNDVITQLATTEKEYTGFCKLNTIFTSKPPFNSNTMFVNVNNKMRKLTAAQQTSYEENDTYWNNVYILATVLTEDNAQVEAFDLKLYMLHSPGQVENYDHYISTFEMEPYNGLTHKHVVSYIKDEKCVQHDFAPILPNIPCLFKNSYPIKIKVIPHYKLMSEQVTELKININKALFKALNSYYAQFGEEPDYDEIYDIIFNADDRIKALVLDEFEYTTYATYWDGNIFKDIPISKLTADNIKHIPNNQVSADYLKNIKNDIGEILFNNLYFITPDNKIYKAKDNELYEYSTLMQEFRTDIIAKSILAGRTPYAKVDNLFRYCVDQQKVELDTTDKVSTYIEIYPHGSEAADSNWQATAKTKYKPVTIHNRPITVTDPQTKEEVTYMGGNVNQFKNVSYKLGPNENIRFLAPSFTTTKTYGNYVKYELILSGSNIHEKDIKFTHSEYENMRTELMNEPIKYYLTTYDTAQDGDTITKLTTYQTFNIPYSDIWKQWKENGFSDDIEFTDINTYGNRLVSVGTLSKDGTFVPSENSEFINVKLSALIKKHSSEIISNWENGTCIIRSNLYFDDLELIDSDYIFNLENNLAEMFYTVNVGTVPSNTDYELKANEYITFFYKNEDNDDAPYIFEKYGEGTIIKPTFPLQGVKNGDEKIAIQTLVGSTGEINHSSLKLSNYQKIASMYSYNDLSGTKSIAIRNLNQLKLKASEYVSYYFITNNVDENNNYTLTTDSNGCYTLNNDEYFIHLNEDKTMFEMLGAGTLLTFFEAGSTEQKRANQTFRVNKVDYVKIANEGLSSFDGSCRTLRSDTIDILLTEQQLYNFSKDDIVTFSIKDTLFSKNDVEEEIEGIVLRTGVQTPIIHYNISYESAGTRGTLPNIALANEQYVWNGTAILNLYCSYDEPQKIGKNQKNMIDEDTGEIRGSVYREITIKNTPQVPTGSDLYLLSNIALNKVGGRNIDVTYFDTFGNRAQPYLFIYNLNQEFVTGYKDTSLTKLVDGSVVVKLKSIADDPLALDITSYGESKLMLKIKNKCDKIIFNLQTSNGTLNPINSSESQNGYGIYYYQLDNNVPIKNGVYELKLIIKDVDGNAIDGKNLLDEDTLVIDSLCKFEYNDIFNNNYNITQQQINERIRQYDVDNIFDYTHSVTSEKYIEDPLDAKSFFNNAHIFNYFTMPMADLYMSDKSESNIVLINNR